MSDIARDLVWTAWACGAADGTGPALP